VNHPVGTRQEWVGVRDQVLVREKEHTRVPPALDVAPLRRALINGVTDSLAAQIFLRLGLSPRLEAVS
jgi:predicted dithiol-disulfide oxidoreductase (DUF899 family)